MSVFYDNFYKPIQPHTLELPLYYEWSDEEWHEMLEYLAYTTVCKFLDIHFRHPNDLIGVPYLIDYGPSAVVVDMLNNGVFQKVIFDQDRYNDPYHEDFIEANHRIVPELFAGWMLAFIRRYGYEPSEDYARKSEEIFERVLKFQSRQQNYRQAVQKTVAAKKQYGLSKVLEQALNSSM